MVPSRVAARRSVQRDGARPRSRSGRVPRWRSVPRSRAAAAAADSTAATATRNEQEGAKPAKARPGVMGSHADLYRRCGPRSGVVGVSIRRQRRQLRGNVRAITPARRRNRFGSDRRYRGAGHAQHAEPTRLTLPADENSDCLFGKHLPFADRRRCGARHRRARISHAEALESIRRARPTTTWASRPTGEPSRPRGGAATTSRTCARGRFSAATSMSSTTCSRWIASNLAEIESRRPPGASARVALFLEFAPGNVFTEVPDPYHGGIEDFERVLDLSEAAARGLLADAGLKKKKARARQRGPFRRTAVRFTRRDVRSAEHRREPTTTPRTTSPVAAAADRAAPALRCSRGADSRAGSTRGRITRRRDARGVVRSNARGHRRDCRWSSAHGTRAHRRKLHGPRRSSCLQSIRRRCCSPVRPHGCGHRRDDRVDVHAGHVHRPRCAVGATVARIEDRRRCVGRIADHGVACRRIHARSRPCWRWHLRRSALALAFAIALTLRLSLGVTLRIALALRLLPLTLRFALSVARELPAAAAERRDRGHVRRRRCGRAPVDGRVRRPCHDCGRVRARRDLDRGRLRHVHVAGPVAIATARRGRDGGRGHGHGRASRCSVTGALPSDAPPSGASCRSLAGE